jgi:hypothetical protein
MQGARRIRRGPREPRCKRNSVMNARTIGRARQMFSAKPAAKAAKSVPKALQFRYLPPTGRPLSRPAVCIRAHVRQLWPPLAGERAGHIFGPRHQPQKAASRSHAASLGKLARAVAAGLRGPALLKQPEFPQLYVLNALALLASDGSHYDTALAATAGRRRKSGELREIRPAISVQVQLFRCPRNTIFKRRCSPPAARSSR